MRNAGCSAKVLHLESAREKTNNSLQSSVRNHSDGSDNGPKKSFAQDLLAIAILALNPQITSWIHISVQFSLLMSKGSCFDGVDWVIARLTGNAAETCTTTTSSRSLLGRSRPRDRD
jgi:hypothetical protein